MTRTRWRSFVAPVAMLALSSCAADAPSSQPATTEKQTVTQPPNRAATANAHVPLQQQGDRSVDRGTLVAELPYRPLLPQSRRGNSREILVRPWLSDDKEGKAAELQRYAFRAFYGPDQLRADRDDEATLNGWGGFAVRVIPAFGLTLADQERTAGAAGGVRTTKAVPIDPVRGQPALATVPAADFAGNNSITWIEPENVAGGLVYIVSGSMTIADLHAIADSFEEI